ncbi:cbb3-type cytochrome c oxidase subunit I, partial [Yoonia sp.]|nr:cbb3-type cytochrome c oxidase subunit I [Yoonia sp.]
MGNYIKLIALGGVTLFAAIGANWGRDVAYIVHAMIIMVVAAYMFVRVLRRMDAPAYATPDGYMDDVVRAGVIATSFWGVIGMLVGVVIAFQLAFPALNFEVLQPYGNFGRLRPLHTSAVIFAFGGNALIMSSFYIV